VTCFKKGLRFHLRKAKDATLLDEISFFVRVHRFAAIDLSAPAMSPSVT
jgi:hypothetical protein